MINHKDDSDNILIRIEKLEKQNRFLKSAVLGVLILFFLLFIIALKAPEQTAKNQPTQNIVEADQFLIKDVKGNVKARLSESGLEFFEKKGDLSCVISSKGLEIGTDQKVTLNGSVFSFVRTEKQVLMPVSTFYPNIPEWTFYDPNGSGRFIINLNRFGIYYYDPVHRSSINLNTKGITYTSGENMQPYEWPYLPQTTKPEKKAIKKVDKTGVKKKESQKSTEKPEK